VPRGTLSSDSSQPRPAAPIRQAHRIHPSFHHSRCTSYPTNFLLSFHLSCWTHNRTDGRYDATQKEHSSTSQRVYKAVAAKSHVGIADSSPVEYEGMFAARLPESNIGRFEPSNKTKHLGHGRPARPTVAKSSVPILEDGDHFSPTLGLVSTLVLLAASAVATQDSIDYHHFIYSCTVLSLHCAAEPRACGPDEVLFQGAIANVQIESTICRHPCYRQRCRVRLDARKKLNTNIPRTVSADSNPNGVMPIV